MSNPPNVKRIFAVDIGVTDDGFIAVVKSLQEDKAMIIKAPTMRLTLNEIGKTIRKRQSYLRRFPIPPPSPIVTIEESLVKPSHFILPENGH